MKNVTCSDIEKVLRKLTVFDEYEKNILITFDMHINQATKLIIKDSINSIMKEIAENEYEIIITLINKTYD